MARGEVVESLGAGLYRLKLFYASDKITAELVRINQRIAELAVIVPQEKLAVIEAEVAANDTRQQINALIQVYQQNPVGAADRMKALQVALVRQTSEVARATYKKDLSVLENLGLLKRRSVLDLAPKEKLVEAWCADFTEDLSGVVGVVDINDEPGQGVIIRPGFSDDATYLPTRDGELFPHEAQSGPQIYFNYAILPGVQKWIPRYRIGEISRIVNDSCTVTLDDAFSSAQSLPINQTPVLENVPIQYMDCNGDAFEDRDRVLVSFTKVGPLVIGFEKEPESCRLLRFAFEPSLAVTEGYTVFSAFRKWFGSPFTEPGGAEINPPLGTENGATPVWTLTNKGEQLQVEKGKSANYGNQNWISKDSEIISWDGPPGRMHDHQFAFRQPEAYPYNTLQNFRQRWMTSGKVYHRLSVIFDLSGDPVAGSYTEVFGAGVRTDLAGQRWLMVVGTEKFFSVGATHRIMQAKLSEQFEVTGSLELVMDYVVPMNFGSLSHWLFSQSGDRAVMSIREFTTNSRDSGQARVIDFDLLYGISEEVVYERGDVGSQVITYNYTSDRRKYELEQRELRTVSESASEYKSLIYCDYVKDERTLVYRVVPAYSLSSNSDNRFFSDGLSPSPPDGSTPPATTSVYFSESFTSSRQSSSEERIVTDKGKVLAVCDEINASSISKTSFNDKAYSITGIGNSLSYSRQNTSHVLEPIFLDARFGFCIASEKQVMESELGSFTDPQETTFSVSGSSQRKEFYSAWLGGARIGETVTIDDSSATLNALEILTGDQLAGTQEPPIRSTAIETDFLALGSYQFIGGFAYRSGKVIFSSMAFSRSLPAGLRLFQFNLLTGKNNPVMDLIERDPDDGFYFHRVGLY